MRAEAAARKQGGRESVLKRRKILATSPHCQPLCKTEDARTRELSNLCASCVRRERVEVEPPLGRARRRRTRIMGKGRGYSMTLISGVADFVTFSAI